MFPLTAQLLKLYHSLPPIVRNRAEDLPHPSQRLHCSGSSRGLRFTWLGGYGSLLGAIGGVLIVEYWILSRCRLELGDLYRPGGRYPKWRPSAMWAFFLGAAPCLPGFLQTVDLIVAPLFFVQLFHYSVFVSFGLAGLLYAVLSWRRLRESRRS